MEKFVSLEPTRLHTSARAHKPPAPTLVGRLPEDLHIFLLTHLPVPDIPSYSRCSRRTASLAQRDKVWEIKWKSLGVDHHKLASVLDDLENKARGKATALRAAAPPTLPVDHIDDDFGDFASFDVLAPPSHQMGDFLG